MKEMGLCQEKRGKSDQDMGKKARFHRCVTEKLVGEVTKYTNPEKNIITNVKYHSLYLRDIFTP